jgi:hypothetical protein
MLVIYLVLRSPEMVPRRLWLSELYLALLGRLQHQSLTKNYTLSKRHTGQYYPVASVCFSRLKFGPQTSTTKFFQVRYPQCGARTTLTSWGVIVANVTVGQLTERVTVPVVSPTTSLVGTSAVVWSAIKKPSTENRPVHVYPSNTLIE